MFHCDCHYTCDVCQRELDPQQDRRYVLRITACDDNDDGGDDDDRDYLQEMHEMLECYGDFVETTADADPDLTIEYDLCRDCRRKFLLDPLPGRLAPQLDFSQN